MKLPPPCPARRCLLLAALLLPSAAPAAINLLVPAYFYPAFNGGENLTGEWKTLCETAGTASITAILNPNSGSFTEADPSYTAAANAFVAAGGTLIGYVHTSGGDQSLSTVKNEIAAYATCYPQVSGIFIDEMSNVPGAGAKDATYTTALTYYREIYRYVTQDINTGWIVIGNPGTRTDQAFINGTEGRTADTFVVCEDFRAEYDDYEPSLWNASYPRDNFAHLIHTTTATGGEAVPDMQLVMDNAWNDNAGYVYVTDDTYAGNPWDSLPSYWAQEVAYAAVIPEPGTLPLALASALAGLILGRRLTRRS